MHQIRHFEREGEKHWAWGSLPSEGRRRRRRRRRRLHYHQRAWR
jgi:hypothetical protein